MIQKQKFSQSNGNIMTCHQKKTCVQPSAGKIMLTVFWDQCGVVMMGFLAKSTTITVTKILCFTSEEIAKRH